MDLPDNKAIHKLHHAIAFKTVEVYARFQKDNHFYFGEQAEIATDPGYQLLLGLAKKLLEQIYLVWEFYFGDRFSMHNQKRIDVIRPRQK